MDLAHALLSVATLAASGCALVLALRSTPRALRRRLDDAVEEIAEVRAIARKCETDTRAAVEAVATGLDAIEDEGQRVETKRKRVAARESKQQPMLGEPVDPMDAAKAQARAAGWRV